MKHLFIFSFIIILFIPRVQSQEEIWGYHSLAGSEGGGMIFTVDPESKEVETIHRFGHGLDNIRTPDNPVFMNNGNGKLYGFTDEKSYMGLYKDLYSYDPISKEIELLVELGIDDQFSAIDSDNIYLTRRASGRNTLVYSFSITQNSLNHIMTIPQDQGNNYQGLWLEIENGVYHTLTNSGGANGSGTLVEIDLNTLKSEALIEFKDDRNPVGSMIIDENHISYGTLSRGNENNFGCIFSVDPKKKEEYNVLASFNSNTGGVPFGEMTLANDGCLYGATASGGTYSNGTFYKFNPNNNSLEAIYHINDLSDEFSQHEFSGYFTQVEDNKLLGILENKIDPAAGKIFSFDLNNRELVILYEFDDKEILLPKGKLTNYNDQLLGIYQDDTIFNVGGIFSFNPINNECTSEKSFYIYDYAEDGQNPNWMCQGANGHIYGMTAYGGKENKGIVFEIDYYTKDFSKLMDVADIGFPIDPRAESFIMGDDVIVGMSNARIKNNSVKDKYEYEKCIFEYNFKTNSFKQLIILPDSLYPREELRKNIDGNLYFTSIHYFSEYNYQDNSIDITVLPDPIYTSDIFEYSYNIYIGNSRHGGSESNSYSYGMLFQWDKNNNEVQRIFDMHRIIPSGNFPASPSNELFCSSNGIIYGDYWSNESNKPSWQSSYSYDFPNDSLLKGHPFRVEFNNHRRNSLEETLDGKYIIKNYGKTDEIIGGLGIYEEEIDSLFSLDLERSPFYYEYEGDGDYYSDAPFDFTDRVDIINVIKPDGQLFWTGNIDSSWYNKENWYLNREPNELSNVNIVNHRPNYPIIDSLCEVGDILIKNKAKMTISSNASLSCKELVNHGELILLANDTAHASFINSDSIINKGSINYSYLANDKKSVALGIPIKHFKIENLDLSVSTFINSDWLPFNNDDVLWPTNAYKYDLDSLAEIQFIGDLNWGLFNYDFNLSSLHLEPVSNPYPCSIDWRNIDLSNMQNKAMYKFNEKDSTFISFIDGLGDASPLIQPLEVFWLNTDPGDQFIVDNQHRLHAIDFDDDLISNRQELVIKVEGQNGSNKTYIAFNNNATAAYDPNYDALKNFFLPIAPPQVFTFGGDEKLDINQLPDTALMDLAVNSREDGKYTLSIEENAGFEFVVLEDLIWNKRIDLLKEDYSFDYFTSDGDYPFKLYFTPWALEPAKEDDIQIYYYPESIVVHSRKQIDHAILHFFDLAGKEVLELQLENFRHYEKAISLPFGHYIVQLKSGDLVVNKKVLVRR